MKNNANNNGNDLYREDRPSIHRLNCKIITWAIAAAVKSAIIITLIGAGIVAGIVAGVKALDRGFKPDIEQKP